MKRPPVISDAVKRGLTPLHRKQATQLLPRTRIGGPMPWIIAIMVALVVLAAGGALALNHLASSANDELSGAITIQIVEADPIERERQTEAVVRLLSGDPRVSSVRAIPPDELNAMLTPWLGEIEAEAPVIPIPALVDARLTGPANEVEQLRLTDLVKRDAPDARIDAQSEWLAPVFSAITSLKWLALMLVAMLAFTGITAVWLASRNALSVNAKTIEVIHLLGGDDDQIARVVERAMRLDAIIGSGVGFVLGMGALLLLGSQFAALDSGLVAGGGLDQWDWLVLLLVPLAGTVIALLTARVTVLYLLRYPA